MLLQLWKCIEREHRGLHTTIVCAQRAFALQSIVVHFRLCAPDVELLENFSARRINAIYRLQIRRVTLLPHSRCKFVPQNITRRNFTRRLCRYNQHRLTLRLSVDTSSLDVAWNIKPTAKYNSSMTAIVERREFTSNIAEENSWRFFFFFFGLVNCNLKYSR